MKIPIKNSLKSVTLFIVTLILLTLFTLFAAIEYFQSKQDMFQMMEDQGLVLLDALMAGAERSILAYEELEKKARDQLLNCARAVEAQDYSTGLTSASLHSLKSKFQIYSLMIIDGNGFPILGDSIAYGDNADNEEEMDRKWPRALLTGETDSLIIGFQKNEQSSGYLVAVHRRRGGAVVLGADANKLLDLRRRVGPGRYIQEIGNRPGVVYVTLQDTLGIRMASRTVRRISSIPEDPFLLSLYKQRGKASRITSFEQKRVFEIVSAFQTEGQPLGLFRIGLGMAPYDHLIRNARIRLALIGISLLLLGMVGFSLVLATQNIRILSESYMQVQTHTGEILQNLKDAVIAADDIGRVTVFNEAAESIYALPGKSVIGRPVSEFDLECFRKLEMTLRTGREIKAEENQCSVQGHLKYLRQSTSVVRNAQGIISSAILVTTDLTEQRRLEETLRRQEKIQAMGTLASGVAHEIRNPINAIGMIAQRFRKEFQPSKDREEYQALTRAMHEEVKRIDRIIQQFLEFAKMPEVKLAPVSIGAFLKEIHSIFGSTASAASIELILNIREEAILRLDADQMKQALLNLLKNGLEATKPGGLLKVTGKLRGSGYLIEIEDSGEGIPEEELGRIFDLYYTTKTQGIGIGLPIVMQIVQGHGGRIDVTSQTGKGTRFQVWLPYEPQET